MAARRVKVFLPKYEFRGQDAVHNNNKVPLSRITNAAEIASKAAVRTYGQPTSWLFPIEMGLNFSISFLVVPLRRAQLSHFPLLFFTPSLSFSILQQ